MLKRVLTLAAAALVAASLAVAADEPATESKTDLSKGGVVFSSGPNSLSIGARVQVRGTWDDREAWDADPEGAAGDGVEDGGSGQFDIPRMRITFKGGMFKPWLKYEFQYEFSRTSGESSSKVKDALLEFETSPAAIVKVGQYKVPFSLQELTSSGRQQFVDRAITNLKFVPARDMGVSLNGLFLDKTLGYAVGVFNGSGESRRQDDQGFLYAGRVYWNPLGEYKLAESAIENPEKAQLHIGLGYRTGEAVRGGDVIEDIGTVFQDPDNQSAANLELAWKWGRFFATGEYFSMTDEQENPLPALADVDSDGWHAQAGVMLIPKVLEVGARYAVIDHNTDLDDTSTSEARLVVGYFWKGHNLKLQGDVGQLSYDAASPDRSSDNRLVSGQSYDDTQVRLQLQLAF